MLPTLEQFKKLKWLKHDENAYPKQVNHFESDGTETKEDVQFMIEWANSMSDSYGYQIVDNYEELQKRLEELSTVRG